MPKNRHRASQGERRWLISGFFYGMAHTLDLGGVLARERIQSSRGFAADRDALRGDWERALGRVRAPLEHESPS